MRRRSLLFLATAGALAGCTSKQPTAPAVAPRVAVAEDYWWFNLDQDLTKGFCFTWVQGLIPKQVLTRLGGKELERVNWQQLVGSGDGPQGAADRYFIGVARVDDWSLIVEDAGDLGVTERLVLPLSKKTRVVAHHRGADGHGRFLLIEDGVIELDFDPLAPNRPGWPKGTEAGELAPLLTEVGFDASGRDLSRSMEAAFALTERLTSIPMTEDLLRSRTYLLTGVPRLPY